MRVRGRTFGVVEDSLDEDGVLCESLCHQQDTFLDAVTTQQRTTTDTLSIMGKKRESEPHRNIRELNYKVRLPMMCHRYVEFSVSPF